jgi:hypothetical protein
LASITAHGRLQRDRIIARRAGDHGIGLAHRHHGGTEIVAVGVHHALAVAVEKALALKALIEELRIGFLAAGQAGIGNGQAAKIDPGLLGDALDLIFAAHKNGLAEPLAGEGHSRAHHLLFFALGKHDAFCRRLTRSKMRLSTPATGSRRAESAARYCPSSTIGRRATPLSAAALATAEGMAEMRRGSNGTGMM